MKVQVALEAETWFAEGRLDPAERATLPADDRTPGPAGISLFSDDVTLSWRDMVVLTLTISDNTTADALLRRVGVQAVNATAARLGLVDTVVVEDLQTLVDSLGRHLGRAGWNDLAAWSATASALERAAADERLLTASAFDPATATRTTPQDMTRLLRLIWTDRAGPPAACARVRSLMAQQLTRHRIASGFRPPVRVAAKSGGLAGVVRNEVGVVEDPDNGRYAVAVFTRARPGADDAAINTAIGAAAATGIAAVRATAP
jgi:beta-lactamase class A